MRFRIFALLGALFVSTCGGEVVESTTTTQAASFPTAVVRDWLDAVAADNLPDISVSVEERSAAILIAAENGYTAEELAAMLVGGLPEGVAFSYWSTFARSFEEFRAVELSALDVGDFRRLEVSDAEFAAVELVGPDRVTEVITRRDESGRWQIDMVATFGPALVRSLRGLLDEAVAREDALEVALGYEEVVIPALEAAVKIDSEDTLLQSQLAAIRVLVSGQ